MNRNATATILLALAIGIYFTFTRGIIDDAKAVQAVNSQYTSAIANAEQLIKVREKVLASYRNLSDQDRERLDKMVPNTVDNIRLVIDLNSIGIRHGLTLKNVKASTATSATSKPTPQQINLAAAQARGARPLGEGSIPTPTLDTVNVTFTTTAPYLEFISFLQDIEANLRLMDVSQLGVQATDDGLYDFTVELKTYWLKQQ